MIKAQGETDKKPYKPCLISRKEQEVYNTYGEVCRKKDSYKMNLNERNLKKLLTQRRQHKKRNYASREKQKKRKECGEEKCVNIQKTKLRQQ